MMVQSSDSPLRTIVDASSDAAPDMRGAPEAAGWRDTLEAAGWRCTPQRVAVFDCLCRAQSHPTAEDVYRAVRRQIPRISLATVYKALEALVAAKLATKLTNGDGSARYDCRAEDHYHLRDVDTGEIRDLPTQFDANLLAKLDPELIERLARGGFQFVGYRLEVLGRFSQPVEAVPSQRGRERRSS